MAKLTRKESKALMRERLINAARPLFIKHGYEAVGVRDVAAAAEASTGSVFGNWSGKADLWKSAMGREAPDPRMFIGMSARMTVRVADDEGHIEDPETALENLIEEARRTQTDLYGERP
jgi:AcrR family transcriptional regulator